MAGRYVEGKGMALFIVVMSIPLKFAFSFVGKSFKMSLFLQPFPVRNYLNSVPSTLFASHKMAMTAL